MSRESLEKRDERIRDGDGGGDKDGIRKTIGSCCKDCDANVEVVDEIGSEDGLNGDVRRCFSTRIFPRHVVSLDTGTAVVMVVLLVDPAATEEWRQRHQILNRYRYTCSTLDPRVGICLVRAAVVLCPQ